MTRTQADSLSQTTAMAVADALRRDIQAGELQPGGRLRQAEVARRFRVSTTPVREAFQMLRAEGLLEVDPHRGAVVFRPSVDDMLATFEIRVALEQLAIWRAVPRLNEEAFLWLETVVRKMSKTTDPGRWRALNREFHATIISYADRPKLADMIAKLTDSTAGYSQIAILRSDREWWADDEHKELIALCRAGDVRGAQRLIAQHLNSTVLFMLEVLDAGDPGWVPPGIAERDNPSRPAPPTSS